MKSEDNDAQKQPKKFAGVLDMRLFGFHGAGDIGHAHLNPVNKFRD